MKDSQRRWVGGAGCYKALLVHENTGDLGIFVNELESTRVFGLTDIVHSFPDAQKKMKSVGYDLIIADLSRIQQAGLDFLSFVKKRKFPGKVMGLICRNPQTGQACIHRFGELGVLPKPIDSNVLRQQLTQYLKTVPGSGRTSIDLLGLLQLIGMDRHSIMLQIEHRREIGFIYFLDGEIVHAEYASEKELVDGEAALMKMIAAKADGKLSARPLGDRTKRRSIDFNFLDEMMRIMQLGDELIKKGLNSLGKTNKKRKQEKKTMEVKEILNMAKEVNGYLGAGVFTPQGELLEGEAEATGIHFESAGAQVHDTLLHAQSMSMLTGFGKTDMIQIDTEGGLVFVKCFNDDANKHFHTILIIRRDGNVAMAKIKLKKMVELLAEEM